MKWKSGGEGSDNTAALMALTVWRAKLRRLEEVLDARLKHLEERS